MKSYDRLFIGGEWVAPSSSSAFDVHSPSTGELVGRTPEAMEADIDKAVAAAREAVDHGPWPHMTPAERGAVLTRAAEAIRNQMQDLSELISNEMGSPVSWGLLAQVLAPTMILDYYAGPGLDLRLRHGQGRHARPGPGHQGADRRRRRHHPVERPALPGRRQARPRPALGQLGGVQARARDAARRQRLRRDPGRRRSARRACSAWCPPAARSGEYLVNHPGVNKVSFTGSTAAGKKIGAACGANLKRFSLELGGKSAAILLDDVKLDESLPLMLPNAIMNNGEACISLTRILAPRDRYTEVTDALVELVRAMKVGDALDPATEVGPLVAERQRDRVESYIRIGQEEGAKVAVGGGRPAGLDTGWFVEPTVFVDVDNSMRIAQEEIFGPVLSVIPYDDDADAVRIANDSDYGLCGGVFTADNDRGLGIARQVRTGTYMVNSSIPIDFSSPFGGYKDSGVGREFGEDGLELFLEKKTINLPAGYTPSA